MCFTVGCKHKRCKTREERKEVGLNNSQVCSAQSKDAHLCCPNEEGPLQIGSKNLLLVNGTGTDRPTFQQLKFKLNIRTQQCQSTWCGEAAVNKLLKKNCKKACNCLQCTFVVLQVTSSDFGEHWGKLRLLFVCVSSETKALLCFLKKEIILLLLTHCFLHLLNSRPQSIPDSFRCREGESVREAHGLLKVIHEAIC